MASAFAAQNSYGVGDDGTGLVIVLDVIYSGVDVPAGRIFSSVRANIPDDASPVVIRQAITTAVQAQASDLGLTVPATRITQPAYNKG